MKRLPPAVPEIPVSDLEEAAGYYVRALGFAIDWSNGEEGIAGISSGDCRLFLTNAEFRRGNGSGDRVVVWINLENREAVDEVHRRWREGGAKLLSAPEDKPWNLHEFRAADLDGNQLRVFYDFTWERRAGKRPTETP